MGINTAPARTRFKIKWGGEVELSGEVIPIFRQVFVVVLLVCLIFAVLLAFVIQTGHFPDLIEALKAMRSR